MDSLIAGFADELVKVARLPASKLEKLRVFRMRQRIKKKMARSSPEEQKRLAQRLEDLHVSGAERQGAREQTAYRAWMAQPGARAGVAPLPEPTTKTQRLVDRATKPKRSKERLRQAHRFTRSKAHPSKGGETPPYAPTHWSRRESYRYPQKWNQLDVVGRVRERVPKK